MLWNPHQQTVVSSASRKLYLCNSAFVQCHYLSKSPKRLWAVDHRNDCVGGEFCLDDTCHHLLSLLVDGAGGFVKDQNPAAILPDNCSCKTQKLLLPLGEWQV
ncbi:hypothetical protein CH063_11923 [Colletotrichum higginsianum]|uniref:Uncharacterized protein n=1 Tax=Colletotrichum higginsianum (strain IMI 349063) TaxID=759273 RepID=H1VNC2_COLHI|nr:hypothetical protein CH063_11923 [Colletotrichum higginsianum]